MWQMWVRRRSSTIRLGHSFSATPPAADATATAAAAWIATMIPRIRLTRSRSNNCAFKGAIIGPNTLAFVGRCLTIGHASYCTASDPHGQTQTPRAGPRRHSPEALLPTHGAGLYRLDQALHSFPQETPPERDG